MRNYAELRQYLQDDLQVKDHILTSDMEISTARALWMSKSFLKKFQDEIDKDADAACLALFKKSNAKCATFCFSPKSSMEEMVINEVKSQLDNLFHRGPDQLLDASSVFEHLAIGPGASVDVDSFNFYTKMFDSTLSCTNDRLYRYYASSIAHDPSWVAAEKLRHLNHGLTIVAGNRLSFVPKTSAISRSICTEPLLNMYFQKGIGSVIQNLLDDRFKINLSIQPERNRELAQKGSVDGSFATIDLSSASDSMSLKLLKEILPPYVFRWLDLARSPNVIFPDGTSEELHMVSSMGNAFTFPLQTLLFTCIVTSCYRVLGIKPLYSKRSPKNFAVFGDDIIVREDAYHFVVDCLSLFGFSVNEEKSFNSGLFRESCGGDYWQGHDIRGVYLKSLKTRADIYSSINRIIRWSAKTGVLLPRVVKLLMSWVKFLPVPYHAGDSEGIKTPYPPQSLKRDAKTGGLIYRAYCSKPNALSIPTSGSEPFVYQKFGRNVRTAHYNPDGLLKTLLGGYLRDGKISLRDEEKSFKTRRRVTSRWRGSIDTFFIDRIERWCRNDRSDARINSGLAEVQSITRSAVLERSVAGEQRLRDDWEVVTELYFS